MGGNSASVPILRRGELTRDYFESFTLDRIGNEHLKANGSVVDTAKRSMADMANITSFVMTSLPFAPIYAQNILRLLGIVIHIGLRRSIARRDRLLV